MLLAWKLFFTAVLLRRLAIWMWNRDMPKTGHA